MAQNFTKYAFSDTSRALQERYGARETWARREGLTFRSEITPEEAAFIASSDGFYLSTVNENGWPYIQYRGGPKGFLQMLEGDTLAFADFAGNKQFLSVANIRDTGKVCLFFMDYANRHRLKIWAEATCHFAEDMPELAEKLTMPNYKAKVERVVVMKVRSFDWNCQQHITPRFTEEELLAAAAEGKPRDSG